MKLSSLVSQQIFDLIESKVQPVNSDLLIKVVRKWYSSAVQKNGFEVNFSDLEIDFSDEDYNDLIVVYFEGKSATRTVFHDLVTILQSELKKYGWFLAKHDEYCGTNRRGEYKVYGSGSSFQLHISPNYGHLIKTPPQFLYHTTLESKLDKIKKVGLIPKSKSEGSSNSWQYPPRVFFRNANTHYFKGSIELTVDTHKIPKVKFYRDATDEDAIWTYSHVPASAIVNIKSLGSAPVKSLDYSLGLDSAF